ncbi:MAG: Kazal-type serine protease inhibitor family protein [Planctomycetota bacterium]
MSRSASFMAVILVSAGVVYGGRDDLATSDVEGGVASGQVAGAEARSLPTGCLSSDDCTLSQFCDKTLGDCFGVGQCQALPTICPTLWDPVCGCDGQTYPNSCVVQLGRTSIDYSGTCAPTSCGSNNACAGDEFCFFDASAGSTGVCMSRPSSCKNIWDPVCGRDRITYANACYAAMAGVSVDYPGECVSPLPTVSEWGLGIMTLLLLTGLAIKFGRCPSAQA